MPLLVDEFMHRDTLGVNHPGSSFLPQGLPRHMEVLIDCSFWGAMAEEERIRLCKQLRCAERCHAKYRNAKLPCSLVFVGFDERMTQLASSLGMGASSWRTREEGLESFLKGMPTCRRTVYLVPDEEVPPLKEIAAGDCFVIGGNVDKPLRPKEASTRARELRSCVCLRLPILEATGLPTSGMDMRDQEGAQVLCLNAVVSILLDFCQSGDWRAAIKPNLPKRLRHMVARVPGEAPVMEASSLRP
mmetsp:Transcript_6080/g.14640  ORF Transcript_6080/g.14640 Transcript_6080/m.14640 type:complete len:245 (-) Transcript_6080:99-833(-)